MNSSHVYLNRVVWWCRTQVLVLTSLATIILLPAYPTAAQHLSAADRMQVDGASLYMEIRSETPEAPILLWLHGGPGGAERPLFRYFNSDRFCPGFLPLRSRILRGSCSGGEAATN